MVNAIHKFNSVDFDRAYAFQKMRQPASESTSACNDVSEARGLAVFAAGYIPPSIAENYAKLQERDRQNGSEFSSARLAHGLAEHPELF